jgi:hypothetical protein
MLLLQPLLLVLLLLVVILVLFYFKIPSNVDMFSCYKLFIYLNATNIYLVTAVEKWRNVFLSLVSNMK